MAERVGIPQHAIFGMQYGNLLIEALSHHGITRKTMLKVLEEMPNDKLQSWIDAYLRYLEFRELNPR